MSECNPEKCLNKCAVIGSMKDHIDEHSRQIDYLLSQTVDHELEGAVAAFAEGHSYTGDQAMMIGDGSEAEPGDIGELCEKIQAHIDDIEAAKNILIDGCAGPLGMRAVRGGVEYTVNVCTSPLAPLDGNNEPVNVTRKEM